MHRLRFPVLALLLLWLPLQAIAAVAMPFCVHGFTSHTTQAAHHAQDASSKPDHHPSHHAQHDPGDRLQCNNCAACNLACAPVVPASTALPAPAPLAIPLYSYFSSRGLFIPDQPQPPPNVLL